MRKLREERESGARDLAVLRADLDATRGDRERLLSENSKLTEEVEKFR